MHLKQKDVSKGGPLLSSKNLPFPRRENRADFSPCHYNSVRPVYYKGDARFTLHLARTVQIQYRNAVLRVRLLPIN